jgi:hypothetical protein
VPGAVITRAFFAPAPAERPAVLRVLTGGFAVVWMLARLPELLRLADRSPVGFDPVGVLGGLDAPVAPVAVRALVGVTFALGIAYTLGWRFRATGPLFALALLLLTTYRSSWGHVLHTDDLLVLHVAVLGVTRSADAWSLDAAAGRTRRPPPETGYGWPPRLMAAVLAATYLLAGIAKLRLSGFDWLDGEALRNHVAYDNLRKVVAGSPSSPLGREAVAHAWPFAAMAWFGLAVELAAPLALLHHAARRAWAAAAWAFHAGVLAMMAITFAYPLSGVAFAPLFPVERLTGAVRRTLRGRWRSPRPEPCASPSPAESPG